jgi:hypothetical protein
VGRGCGDEIKSGVQITLLAVVSDVAAYKDYVSPALVLEYKLGDCLKCIRIGTASIDVFPGLPAGALSIPILFGRNRDVQICDMQQSSRRTVASSSSMSTLSK